MRATTLSVCNISRRRAEDQATIKLTITNMNTIQTIAEINSGLIAQATYNLIGLVLISLLFDVLNNSINRTWREERYIIAFLLITIITAFLLILVPLAAININ